MMKSRYSYKVAKYFSRLISQLNPDPDILKQELPRKDLWKMSTAYYQLSSLLLTKEKGLKDKYLSIIQKWGLTRMKILLYIFTRQTNFMEQQEGWRPTRFLMNRLQGST